MLSKNEIIETVNMVDKEHLDIRTITMGISLFPCVRDTAEKTAAAVYDRIMKKAENIVSVADELSKTYGIPIINKRVSDNKQACFRYARKFNHRGF